MKKKSLTLSYIVLVLVLALMLSCMLAGCAHTGSSSGYEEYTFGEDSGDSSKDPAGGDNETGKNDAGVNNGGNDAASVLTDFYTGYLTDKYGTFDVKKEYVVPYDGYHEGHLPKGNDGLVNFVVDDLDGDKTDELLTLRVLDNDFILEIYEYDKGGNIERRESKKLIMVGYDDVDFDEYFHLSFEIQEFDLGIMDQNGKKYIAADMHDVACMYADGVSSEIDIYQYDGERLITVFSDDFCGSDADDYECAKEKNELKKLGFVKTTEEYSPFYKGFADETGLSRIFSLRGENENVYLRDYYRYEEFDAHKKEDCIRYVMSLNKKVEHEDFHYDHASTVDNGDYIFPDSDSRKLEEKELYMLSDLQLRLARNEIYARHGRRFDDKELQSYFDSKSWYNGTIAPNKFDESVFNKYEKYNKELISEYESRY